MLIKLYVSLQLLELSARAETQVTQQIPQMAWREVQLAVVGHGEERRDRVKLGILRWLQKGN